MGKMSEQTPEVRIYTLGEEIANAVTHGIGAVISIAALVLLVIRAAANAPAGQAGVWITGMALYGASLIVLYLASTVYHAVPASVPDLKRFLAVIDHMAIYLLIAGTYTALCLSFFYGPLGWTLVAIEWFLACLGGVLYSLYQQRVRKITFTLYLIMGWLGVFAIGPICERLSTLSMVLLSAGGVAYTLGCIFYAMKRTPWMHPVWHLFVLAGSVLQFFAIYVEI